MSDTVKIFLTTEEKLQRARGQFNAMVLGMLAYLRERGVAIDACMAFVGGRIAQGWDPELAAIEFLKEEAMFLISVGCDLRKLSGDAHEAEAVFRSWPPDADWTTEGFLSFWKLGQEDADLIWEMYRPIANRLGLDYQWHRTGGEVTMTFSRRPG